MDWNSITARRQAVRKLQFMEAASSKRVWKQKITSLFYII